MPHRLAALSALLFFALPAVAMADVPAAGPDAGVLPLYLLAISALVPLVGYVLNHYAPWASEQAKGVAQAVLAAGVAVLYQAAAPGDLGLNDATLLAVLTAMGTSLFAHLGWKAAGINVTLGAGRNAQD